MVDYKVNEAAHKVSCVIFVGSSKAKTAYVGRARCNPSDKFDIEFGKDLAYKRALLKLKKAETAYHKKSIHAMRESYERTVRAYKHHNNALTHNSRRVNELKAELSKMLGR